jgi:type I restriction enzyme, R subunit
MAGRVRGGDAYWLARSVCARHKQCFYIFDYCQNLEFFGQNPAGVMGAAGLPLGTRLFVRRLEMLGELDSAPEGRPDTLVARERQGTFGEPATDADVRQGISERLHTEVEAMNLDNFIVRPKRRLVEKFKRSEAWTGLTPDDRLELSTEVAGLPSELEAEPEEAKRFDLLLLNLQLAVLRHEPAFERLRDQVKSLAGLLLYQSPFTDLTPRGPDGLFTSLQVDELVRILEHVKATAQAA